MHFSILLVLLICSSLEEVFGNDTVCESFSLPSKDQNTYVTCKGNFTELDSLKRSLGTTTGLIRVFELQDALIDVLPPDIFQDVPNQDIRKVIFDNVTLGLLKVPELGDSPFKSISNTVETMEIYNCSIAFAWDFPDLIFDNLKELIIADSELIAIRYPFYFWHDLQFVQIQNSSLHWIHDKAFRGNEKLVICSLARNSISRIKRSMFPSPAKKLYSLDLSFNRISYLPSDMFTKMDMLHELKLDNNLLTSVSRDFLKPVWNNLIQLWLDDNEISCDSLCWITEETGKPMFLESSKCKSSGKAMLVNMYLEKCIQPINNF